MKTKVSNLKYQRAKSRVEKLRRFYSHLVVYLIVNTIISIFKVYYYMDKSYTFEDAFLNLDILFTWLIWGLALAIHAFAVFILPKLIGNNWEEQKIKEIMEEELSNKSKY